MPVALLGRRECSRTPPPRWCSRCWPVMLLRAASEVPATSHDRIGRIHRANSPACSDGGGGAGGRRQWPRQIALEADRDRRATTPEPAHAHRGSVPCSIVRKWSAAAARAAGVAARGESARARAARCWWTTASGHRMYNFGLRCIKLSLLDLDSRTPIPGSYVFSLKSLDRRSAPSRLAGPSWHAGRPGRASCRKPPAPPDQGLVLVLAES
jgi:hypothetical protein